MRTSIANAVLALSAGLAMGQDAPLADAIFHDGGVTWAGIVGLRFAPLVMPVKVDLPATRTPPGLPDPMPDAEEMESIVAGYVEPSPRDYFADLVWTPQPDGSRVAALVLSSANCTALRVQVEGLLDQMGLQLRVFDPRTGDSFGPYAQAAADENKRWWSTIIFGDSIGLELRLLPGHEMPAVGPKLVAINYHYVNPPMYSERGCSLIDALCRTTGSDERSAITLLCVVGGSGNLSSFCTGSRWNRTPSDLSPLIHTANHCIGTNASANNTVLVWNFRTATCNGTAPNINTLPRSTGCTLLKTNTDNDYNLMGSLEPVTGGWWLGWTSATPGVGGAIYGLSHPSGTFLKISTGVYTGADRRTFCDTAGNCFDADVWNVSWTEGQTLPGSSGSPLIDMNGRARGVLTGGPSSDCTISRYGRFDADSYNSAQPYIDGPANPCFVWRSTPFPGSENGTAGFPFNRVIEGFFAVPEGGTLNILPDTYPENVTLWRPMTLQRSGSSGEVTIGS